MKRFILGIALLLASFIPTRAASGLSQSLMTNFNRLYFQINLNGGTAPTNMIKVQLTTNFIVNPPPPGGGTNYGINFSTNIFIENTLITYSNSITVYNESNLYLTNGGNIYIDGQQLFTTNIFYAQELWTNISSVLQPTTGASVLVSNLTSALTLTASGSFSMPTSGSSNLVTGENDLNPYQQGSMLLSGPTTDPDDTTISLSAGGGTGQILFLENATEGFGFSLTNGTPKWDASGTIILSSGDWKPTHAGETLFLIQSQTGNWQEVGRFGGGVPGDNFWQLGIAAPGVLSPMAGTSVWATNVNAFTKLAALGSFTTPQLSIYSVNTGTNTVDLTTASLVNVSSLASSGVVIELTKGDGDIGQHIWMFNVATNTGFCLYSGVATDDTNVIVQIRGDQWCPTQQGESIELVKQAGGWVEIGRANPNGNAPAIINPTDGYVPYRLNANTFADSQLYRGSEQVLSMITTNNNTPIFYISPLNTNVNTGTFAVRQADSDGQQDVAWLNGVKSGSWGLGVPGGRDGLLTFNVLHNNSMAQRFSVDGASGDVTFLSSDGLATQAFISGTSGYSGAGTKFLADDGTYKTGGGGGGTTINPTNGFLPYRVNSTTFADSPWFRISATALGFQTTNYFLQAPLENVMIGKDAMTSIIPPHGSWDQDWNTILGSGGVLGAMIDGEANTAIGAFAASSTTNSIDSIYIGNEVAQNLARSSGSIHVGAHAGDNAAYTEASTFLGWHAEAAVGSLLTNAMAIGARTVVTNSNEIVIGNASNTAAIFPIASYTGTGTLFLSDDGTFKAAGGGDTLWATNTGSASISPTVAPTLLTVNDLGSIGIGLTNVFYDKDLGVFHRADLEGSRKAFINIGAADTYPFTANNYGSEWWANAGTNDAVMCLTWDIFPAGSGTQRDHVWTAGNSGSFFYYHTKKDGVITFELNGEDGNLNTIKGVDYDWPAANDAGALVNDGSGGLSWESVGGAVWGNITGNIVNQTDLSTALTNKVLKAGDTMTGNLTTPNTIVTNSLIVDAGLISASNKWAWGTRTAAPLTNFPVATAYPSTTAMPMVMDLMPSTGALDVSGQGVVWFDLCNTNVLTTSDAVSVLRLGIYKNGNTEFGTRGFQGGSGGTLAIQVNEQNKLLFQPSYTIAYQTIYAGVGGVDLGLNGGGYFGSIYMTGGLNIQSTTGQIAIGTGAEFIETRDASKGGRTKALTSTTAASILYIPVSSTNSVSGDIIWEIRATDGTDTQTQTGHTLFGAVGKSTAVTAGLTTTTNAAVVSAGTLTAEISSNVTTNNVLAIAATGTTSLTTTNLVIKWRLTSPGLLTVNAL